MLTITLIKLKNISFFTIIFIFMCMIIFSCTFTTDNSNHTDLFDTISVVSDKESLLVTDENLRKENDYGEKVDELFDDFLYSYIHDHELQIERTIFPLHELQINGDIHNIKLDEWYDDFSFMNGEYTTNIYNNEKEMLINEDTALIEASVEKIDLESRIITTYKFVKVEGKWNLHAVSISDFEQSDLFNFLDFYSRFTLDTVYQESAIANSIHISTMDPDDETLTIDGFINKEQWNTMNSGLPVGVITNIRYGQLFKKPRKILLEKISMGNGMSEIFIFQKKGNKWKLIGYEN